MINIPSNRKEYYAEYYIKNKERLKQKRRKWYEDNKEKAIKNSKKYAKEHKEHINYIRRKKYIQKRIEVLQKKLEEMEKC